MKRTHIQRRTKKVTIPKIKDVIVVEREKKLSPGVLGFVPSHPSSNSKKLKTYQHNGKLIAEGYNAAIVISGNPTLTPSKDNIEIKSPNNEPSTIVLYRIPMSQGKYGLYLNDKLNPKNLDLVVMTFCGKCGKWHSAKDYASCNF